jgi:hypothetical protein
MKIDSSTQQAGGLAEEVAELSAKLEEEQRRREEQAANDEVARKRADRAQKAQARADAEALEAATHRLKEIHVRVRSVLANHLDLIPRPDGKIDVRLDKLKCRLSGVEALLKWLPPEKSGRLKILALLGSHWADVPIKFNGIDDDMRINVNIVELKTSIDEIQRYQQEPTVRKAKVVR